MSTINPLSSLTAAQTSGSSSTSSTSASSSANASTIGMTDFLQLLVAQLQNQDPLNPMDNDQFLTQLATFSSLQQLISINQAVTALAGTGSSSTSSGSSTGSGSSSSTTQQIF